MFRLVSLSLAIAITVPLYALAQSLPVGNLVMTTGDDYGHNADCLSGPLVGHLFNPGPSKLGTEVEIDFLWGYTFGGTVLVMSEFPAQPASGLNGWTAAAPTYAKFSQYGSSGLVASGRATVSFAIQPLTSTVSSGIINVTAPNGCTNPIYFTVSATHAPTQ